MNTNERIALVLDVDGTITPARQPIEKEMADILSNLKVDFYLAAGSDFKLLESQLFKPLYNYNFRKSFYSYISNGSIKLYCDFINSYNITTVSEFNLKEYLGQHDYHYLVSNLEIILNDDVFPLPNNLTIFLENRFVDRVSMINLCPIGRDNRHTNINLENREKFIKFDKETNYRKNILSYLNEKLKHIIIGKQLRITYGGQTSFDIGILGEDKTKPIRELVNSKQYDRIIFIGDALYENGNDYVVQLYINNWPFSNITKCPVETISVKDYKETMDILKEYMFNEKLKIGEDSKTIQRLITKCEGPVSINGKCDSLTCQACIDDL